VAGRIPLQLQDGAGGFLVDSVDECADRVLWLLRHSSEADELAARGHDLVRKRFLLTRLIADELRLYASLLGTRQAAGTRAALVGLADEDRDPVCGMRMDPRKANPGIQRCSAPVLLRRVPRSICPRARAVLALAG
jgi:trehalose synthase